MKNIEILYIYPFESYGFPSLLNNFIRISNFLNSKKKELEGSIEEEYLDLRYENLPNFIPKNIEKYRIELTKLLKQIYSRFEFNLAAISCYRGYSYINTIEIANLIKHYINPLCIVVVGGPFNPKGYFIITNSGEKIGCIGSSVTRRTMYLHHCMVSPKFQGQGIFTYIIQKVISEGIKKGKEVLLQVLDINERARNLYLRLGFKITGRNGVYFNMKYNE